METKESLLQAADQAVFLQVISGKILVMKGVEFDRNV
jgi:hypothetical protein